MSLDIVVIDYGFSNLHSVLKAIKFIGIKGRVVENAVDFRTADGIIIPGVGAFEDGMRGLEGRNLITPIKEYAISGKPILGICLGMQFLFTYSEEFGENKGLNLIPGRVIFFPAGKSADKCNYKIPHIGWNRLIKPSQQTQWDNTILANIQENEEVYFLHSFVVDPDDKTAILAQTEYGGTTVTAVVKSGNIYGCQFHAEKSRETGIKILQNFVDICK